MVVFKTLPAVPWTFRGCFHAKWCTLSGTLELCSWFSGPKESIVVFFEQKKSIFLLPLVKKYSKLCVYSVTYTVQYSDVISILRCPPRAFIPALCKIFLDKEAPDNVLEVTARAITYYLDVSVDCTRRITAVDGALKAIISRMQAADLQSRASKDMAEQCVKVSLMCVCGSELDVCV